MGGREEGGWKEGMGGKKGRREEGKKDGMGGWNGRMEEGRKEWEDGRGEKGRDRKKGGGWMGGRKEGSRKEEGRMEGREGQWKRGQWKEGEDGKGQEGRDRKKGGRKEGLQRVGPLITIGGVVVICLSVHRWLWLFVCHCALITVDGVVVVVWVLIALMVWACVSINGKVVEAAFWLAILNCVIGGRRQSWDSRYRLEIVGLVGKEWD